jgi:transcriptional regulator with XRE-family HTH domain
MKGLELQRAREALGVSHRELAEYADVTPNDIVRWEQCETVPPDYRTELAVALWVLRLEAALRRSGLPECPYIAAQGTLPAPSEVEELREHLATCPACGARERYVRQQVGEPPIRVERPSLGGRVRRLLNTLHSWRREAGQGVVLATFLAHRNRIQPISPASPSPAEESATCDVR